MPAEGKVFRLTEVAEHNKAKGEDKSIWTVIHDKVYDITKFLDEVHNDDAIVDGVNYITIVDFVPSILGEKRS